MATVSAWWILDRPAALRRAGKLGLRQTDPTFPKPVQLSPRRIGYYEDEWSAWLASRARVEAAAG